MRKIGKGIVFSNDIFRILKEVKTMQNIIEHSKNNIEEYDEEARYRYVQKNAGNRT